MDVIVQIEVFKPFPLQIFYIREPSSILFSPCTGISSDQEFFYDCFLLHPDTHFPGFQSPPFLLMAFWMHI